MISLFFTSSLNVFNLFCFLNSNLLIAKYLAQRHQYQVDSVETCFESKSGLSFEYSLVIIRFELLIVPLIVKGWGLRSVNIVSIDLDLLVGCLILKLTVDFLFGRVLSLDFNFRILEVFSDFQRLFSTHG